MVALRTKRLGDHRKITIGAAKAGLERIPTSPIELTEEQMEEVEAIVDKLEDDDDVQAVYTTLA